MLFFSSSFLLFLIATFFSISIFIIHATTTTTTSRNNNDIYAELGEPTFRSPKNILFVVTLGGSSHGSWVARILNELTLRGHFVTYAATDIQMKYIEPYPHIESVLLGSGFWSKLNSHNRTFPRPWNDFKGEIDVSTENYEQIYTRIQQIISEKSYDVIICDQFSTACSDAARVHKVPSIQTMLMNLSPDAFAPYINKCRILLGETTTEHMTLPYRFYKKFLFPIAARWKLGSSRKKYQQKRMSVASNSSKITTTHPLLSLNDPGTDSLKIVNNFFGIEEARPMGPLIEMIGPIYNAHYDPLPPFIQQFLDLHQRVVFVAFGQHASAKPIDTTKILTQLLDLLETKVIDGFIWGLVKSSSGLPDTVTTQSGRIYDVSKEFLFDNNNKDAEESKRENKEQQQQQKHPDVILLPWAPQFSILKHPSVVTYLSHGGGMSIFEALYAGKRTVIKPFFGDQPGHALFFEREQLGGYLNMQDQNKGTNQVFDDPFKTLQRVIQDKDGVIQKNVNRYQALVQIRAKNAVVRGADLVEEVLFTSKDGYLPHRHDVRKKLSYLKANDYDLYLCLVGIATMTFGLLSFLYLKMIQSFFIIDKQPKNKIKNL